MSPEIEEIARNYRASVSSTNSAALNSHLADPVTLQALIDAATAGLNDKSACEAAGLHPETLQRWQKNVSDNPQQSPPHTAFILALKEARARGKLELLNRIKAASEKPQFWTAAAWTLERTDPEQFALRKDDSQVPRVVVQLGGNVGDVKVGILLAGADAKAADGVELQSFPALVSQNETDPLK
jgi:hypothetical protein